MPRGCRTTVHTLLKAVGEPGELSSTTGEEGGEQCIVVTKGGKGKGGGRRGRPEWPGGKENRDLRFILYKEVRKCAKERRFPLHPL